ncbi:MAG: hypothetical protein EAZ09_04170, partial [Oscillatoriales cyanobacterium]
MSGSSATDSVTDLTDVRKFGNGFCNGFNGCQEEGRRFFNTSTEFILSVAEGLSVQCPMPNAQCPILKLSDG